MGDDDKDAGGVDVEVEVEDDECEDDFSSDMVGLGLSEMMKEKVIQINRCK